MTLFLLCGYFHEPLTYFFYPCIDRIYKFINPFLSLIQISTIFTKQIAKALAYKFDFLFLFQKQPDTANRLNRCIVNQVTGFLHGIYKHFCKIRSIYIPIFLNRDSALHLYPSSFPLFSFNSSKRNIYCSNTLLRFLRSIISPMSFFIQFHQLCNTVGFCHFCTKSICSHNYFIICSMCLSDYLSWLDYTLEGLRNRVLHFY